jgi:hypothetical protein
MHKHKTVFFAYTYNGCQRSIYQHTMLAAGAKAVYIFADGLWDEKRILRSMYIVLAQKLNKAAAHTVLFDYFGTGVSNGSTADFSLAEAQYALAAIVNDCEKTFPGLPLVLVGARFGADIAVHAAAKNDAVTHCILIEPLLAGSTCLKQMLGRRKITHAMNGMKVPVKVMVQQKEFTDQLGYLVSEEDEQLLANWQTNGSSLRQKKINLICTKHSSGSNAILQFYGELQQQNDTQLTQTALADFWVYKDEFDYTDMQTIFSAINSNITQQVQ